MKELSVAQKLLEKIFHYLNEDCTIILKFGNGKKTQLGYNIPEDEAVVISISNINKKPVEDNLPSSPIVTLIHEALHNLYENANEDIIILLTQLCWESITKTQKLALYEMIFEPTT